MASHESITALPSLRIKDLRGQTFGLLEVVDFAGTGLKNARGAHWLCRCVCGNETIVRGSILKRITSCGCHIMVHGPGAKEHWREYQMFMRMWQRCTNPKTTQYKDYGGRGIFVCERWQNFETFLADVGPRPSPLYSLDRIDNDGPYSPENTRWATRSQQAKNSRNITPVTFQGESMPLPDWAKKLGVTPEALYWRLKHGWPLEKVLTTGH